MPFVSFVPLRQLMARHLALASMSSAAIDKKVVRVPDQPPLSGPGGLVAARL
jgi:hypothetical protein